MEVYKTVQAKNQIRFDSMLESGSLVPLREYPSDPKVVYFETIEVDGDEALVIITAADYGRGQTTKTDLKGKILKITL